jgi:hypothetical protein
MLPINQRSETGVSASKGAGALVKKDNMNFDISKKQDWKLRKATADMLWLTRSQKRLTNMQSNNDAFTFSWCFLLATVLFIGGCLVSNPAHAYTDEQIVTAIGKAENSKTHPYGIMVKYRKTSPKQACLNTVRHLTRLWVKNGSKGSLIAFIGHSYAPIGATNDQNGLNRNWVKNVNYFLTKESK